MLNQKEVRDSTSWNYLVELAGKGAFAHVMLINDYSLNLTITFYNSLKM